MAKRENDYQAGLIKRIEQRFPGCLVMKNDDQYRQGTPDLTILHHERWAVLEVKRSEDEIRRSEPNQSYYISKLNVMGFASFIYPENEERVLDAIQRAFES